MMWAVQIIETIKAGAAEQETLVRLSGHQTRMTNSLQRIGVANSFLIAMPPLLSLATTAAILWIGGARVIDGVMSVGALVAMQTLMANLNRPFGDLVRLGSSVQSLQAELARLRRSPVSARSPLRGCPITQRRAVRDVRVWTICLDPCRAEGYTAPVERAPRASRRHIRLSSDNR